MNCLLSNFTIFPDFRQPGRQMGYASENWHEHWSLHKVVLFNCARVNYYCLVLGT